MKFRTRIISTAVAAAIGTFAGAAQAVNLGADGQGQVLIYPYYTVQQKGTTAFDTYIEVVNSDGTNGKAVKVRILEGKNSVEVLDFNLYLSPADVWTATLTRGTDGNGILRTRDNSCTAPEIPVVSTAGGVTTREVPFTNVAYAKDAAVDASMGRAKEGYVEIIQMADIVAGLVTNQGLNTFTASKHSGGVPPNCAGIRNAWSPPGGANDYSVPANDGVGAPTGQLSGSGTIINPIEGTMSSYDAVAIDRFSNVALHFEPGSIQPQLSDVTPKISAVFQGTDVVFTDWAGQTPLILPVSAVLLRNQIVNTYAVGAAGTGMGSDWVVTFPTKQKHITEAVLANKLPFTSTLSSTGACEAVLLTAYDREEQLQGGPGIGFSPPPPAGGPESLCWEVNVVSMGYGTLVTSNVLGSATGIRKTLALPYQEGWLRMGFAQSRVSPATTFRDNIETGVRTTAVGFAATYTGLPVVGFAAQSLANTGTLPNTNYGSIYGHRYTRSIAP